MSLMGQCLNDTVLLISESDVIALFIPQKSFLCEMLDLVGKNCTDRIYFYNIFYDIWSHIIGYPQFYAYHPLVYLAI